MNTIELTYSDLQLLYKTEKIKTKNYEAFLDLFANILPEEYTDDECKKLLNLIRKSSKMILSHYT